MGPKMPIQGIEMPAMAWAAERAAVASSEALSTPRRRRPGRTRPGRRGEPGGTGWDSVAGCGGGLSFDGSLGVCLCGCEVRLYKEWSADFFELLEWPTCCVRVEREVEVITWDGMSWDGAGWDGNGWGGVG